MRLDKFLVDCGLGSRTEVKVILKKKNITVNDIVESSAKRQIDEKKDRVAYKGKLLTHEKWVYYLLNKPSGVISATEDRNHKTVIDLLDNMARQKQVFPVGRLDKDTRGLLLLTNDGDLAHVLLSPKKHVSKVYRAFVDGIMTAEDQIAFKKGIILKDFTCQPAQLEILEIFSARKQCLVQVTLSEGKFHQVKRMVQSCGKTVLDLQRIAMGSLVLDASLAEGEWRRLTAQELEQLLDMK